MCTSQKKLEANFQNAQKSTGPKTQEGKKISSQNATIHGLNSVNIIITSPHLKEDQDEYDHLAASLIFELQPQTTLQQHLVYKIINCHWRYRRLINAETALINRQTHPDGFAYQTSEFMRDQLEAKGLLESFLSANLVPKEDESQILSRYEYRLSRELERSCKLLLQLQGRQENLDNTDAPYVKKWLENQKQQNEPIPAPPSPVGKGAGGLGSTPENVSPSADFEKQQNEPKSPEPNLSQQPIAPPPPNERLDKDLHAIQNDRPLPQDPPKYNPASCFIKAMEISYGLK